MLERKPMIETIAPAITRNRKLAITRTRKLKLEQIKQLKLPLIFKDDQVIIEKSLTDWSLKEPVSIPLNQILETGEIGLVDYIIRSCLSQYPSIISYIFENQSLVKMARHFFRHCSPAQTSCRTYSYNVKKYANWFGHKPDAIIFDIKPVGAIPDPQRVLNHCAFLEDYLAELQDSGLKPGSVHNCIKAVKTFYRENGCKVELKDKLARKKAYKDRAPTPDELTKLLNNAATREAFVVAAIATGGFREETFSELKYRHVKEDLEANRFPIHIHVEAEITKGKYHDYDTFINAEASKLLKQYIEDRKKGTRKIPPEELTDESPLLRNTMFANKVRGISGRSVGNIIHKLLVEANVAKKLHEGWMYSVRTHSLRKYFRTQMSATKIDDEIIKYFMGKTIDTYEDVQSLGIETLRNLYVAADLSIRPKTIPNRIEQLKEIIRGWGENPEEILCKDALLRGNSTDESPAQIETHQMSLLVESLKDVVKREVLK